MSPGYKFSKKEKLNDLHLITAIFNKQGQSVFKPPILLAYYETELNSPFPVQVLFSVSKKKFQRAHDRNRIKRLMSESYRMNKHRIYEALADKNKQYAIAFLYLDNVLPDHGLVDDKLNSSINEFIKRVS